ncbi:GNAT family N-acetyltransferase [Alteromonadaceae bacterium M269]|nr:GNAT family N-acetyltransferase [Alteromonadaceae bacterium M269]
MTIQEVTKNDYQELIAVWESSVRATHHFLSEAHIAELKPLILDHYFDAVNLRCVKADDQTISGFIGVADNNIEILFVSPHHFGRGIGRTLITYAIQQLSATKVDVNEQNPGAIEFYYRVGFVSVGRSDLDGQGNPFPLIHMQLK